MGIFEIILILLIIAAISGRGRLELGMVFDVLIAFLAIALIYRLFYMFF